MIRSSLYSSGVRGPSQCHGSNPVGLPCSIKTNEHKYKSIILLSAYTYLPAFSLGSFVSSRFQFISDLLQSHLFLHGGWPRVPCLGLEIDRCLYWRRYILKSSFSDWSLRNFIWRVQAWVGKFTTLGHSSSANKEIPRDGFRVFGAHHDVFDDYGRNWGRIRR